MEYLRYQEVDSREPKIAFLLANTFKKIVKGCKKEDILELEREYQRLKSNFYSSKESTLESQFKDKTRLRRYNSFDWHRRKMPLEDMGVWPEMQGLAIELTIGNVLETAIEVKKSLEEMINGSVPEKFITKLKSMENIFEFVYNNFPLVVFPGGEIREKDHNRWIRINNLIYPECKVYDVDIDDGSSRSIFYALRGIKEASVYRGKYR